MEEQVMSLFEQYELLVVAVVVLVSERTFEVVVGRVLKPLGRLLASFGVSIDGWFTDLTMVLSWLWVALFVAATGIDLFEGMLKSPWGVVLTCLVAGAGTNLLHEVFGALQGIKLWGRSGGSSVVVATPEDVEAMMDRAA